MPAQSRSTPLTLLEFQRAITPAYLKTLQVFYIALSTGVLVFFFVAFFFYVENTNLRLGASDEMVGMLTVVHVIYAVAAYAAAALLYRRALVKARAGADGAGSAESILAAIRLAAVVRLAIFEGVAFFGLVVLFIGAQTGMLQASPMYWVNLFSTVILFALVMRTYPSREHVERVCRTLVLEQ
jgi:hypothetical protein